MHPIVAAILLLLAGFAFIFLELLIPSAGLIGIISAILIIAGIVIAFGAGIVPGFILLGVTIVSLPIFIALLLKIWPNTPIGKRLFSSLPSADDVEPEAELVEALQSLIGKSGVARSKLLPAGGITIDGKHYDAVSDGLPIEKDQEVKVVSVKAQRIFVRPVLKSVEERTSNDQLSQSIESLGLDELDDPLAQ